MEGVVTMKTLSKVSMTGVITAAMLATAAPGVASAQEATCDVDAKACVSISNQTAWLQDGNGNTTYGPVTVSTGKPGLETPQGRSRVTRQVKDEWSVPYNGPMPYATYFSAGAEYPNDIGIAFHQGDPAVKSAGCVRMDWNSAETFFNELKPGDVVHVVQ